CATGWLLPYWYFDVW
nr:immunoglobulin heavy chain junction region [Mus musculus]NSM06180.1 immunoglobulin heavy chain junction region [Mus musculus]